MLQWRWPWLREGVVVKTIMVADGEEGVRKQVSAALGGDSRYRLVLAGDGEEALELARREKPDLLLLDSQLPRMNGYQVCHTLKSDPSLKDITIIMLGGLDQERQEATEAGADGYLTKPLSRIEWLQKVEGLLGPSGPRDEEAATAGQQGETPPSFDQMSHEQMRLYASEVQRLFLEERRLRQEVEERNRLLEQRVREVQGLNRLFHEYLTEWPETVASYRHMLQEFGRLLGEIQALLTSAESLPSPNLPDVSAFGGGDDEG
jgi:CheY-like chemotaxis protein